ncbi:hypothetical protein BpHYR1_013423 [Brachionus plicatilis]|uniref:Uncharacterized protein n=1 Tax=Brachionus plicatilis TaxID=10195 RepID=A0A3M7Q162_BRAPC|nr:hypothetical protein BpHYR1_013423 [Brachionus plicatilis]
MFYHYLHSFFIRIECDTDLSLYFIRLHEPFLNKYKIVQIEVSFNSGIQIKYCSLVQNEEQFQSKYSDNIVYLGSKSKYLEKECLKYISEKKIQFSASLNSNELNDRISRVWTKFSNDDQKDELQQPNEKKFKTFLIVFTTNIGLNVEFTFSEFVLYRSFYCKNAFKIKPSNRNNFLSVFEINNNFLQFKKSKNFFVHNRSVSVDFRIMSCFSE